MWLTPLLVVSVKDGLMVVEVRLHKPHMEQRQLHQLTIVKVGIILVTLAILEQQQMDYPQLHQLVTVQEQ